jgi:stage III sporulation protein AB
MGDSPVSRLFREMSKRFEARDAGSFAEIWCGAFRRNREELALKSEETEILCDLGASLGRYDLENEERTLKLATRRLERCLEAAREKQTREGRLCSTLGISAGIVSAIILL